MIHYSGNIQNGRPVQEAYQKIKAGRTPEQVEAECAAGLAVLNNHRAEVKRKRRADVFAEMLANPKSKYHGSSYSYTAGCPCNCDKCLEKRAWMRERKNQKSREYAAIRKEAGR